MCCNRCTYLVQQPAEFARRRRRREGRAPSWRRRGVTLVELLVVVGIILTLVALSVPTIQPLMEGRDIREASRALNAYIGSAQARAMSLNRPVAIWFQRLEGKPGMVLEVYHTEVPAPYSGDVDGARAILSGIAPFANGVGTIGLATFSPAPAIVLNNVVHTGDFIRFDFRGPYYQINNVTPTSVVFRHPLAAPPQSPPSGVPFQVYLYGIRSSTPPVQLPNQVAIDIADSGVGSSGKFSDQNTGPVMVVFSPNGRLDYVSANNTIFRPTSAVHILVGRPDQVNGENLLDPLARWVSVGHQTGRVTTAENIPNASLAGARINARRSQTMGGR